MSFQALIVVVLSFAVIMPSIADEEWSLIINDDIEIEIKSLGDSQSVGLIWFTCNQGEETTEYQTAQVLLGKGYQVFFPDILSAHFMSPTASNISKITTDEAANVVMDIIQKGKAETYYLVGGARAAVPVLKALSDQRIKSIGQLKGALLLTPRVNKLSPEPGSLPVFVDEIGESTLAINILEGERTPNRWGLPYLKSQLSLSGSEVRTGLIKGVRGFFYLRTEKTAMEVEMTEKLPQIIDENIQLFNR